MADSYIVRIYRRDHSDTSLVTGVVIGQHGGMENRETFNTSAELLSLLALKSTHGHRVVSKLQDETNSSVASRLKAPHQKNTEIAK